jgi:hypothetical protein
VVRPLLAGPEEVVVVGATWTVCAQLRAALPLSVPVGCAGPDPADFARWAPASKWSRAELVVLVHDNRAPADAAALFPDRTLLSQHELETRRGDRLGRRFTIEVLARRAIASSPPSAQPPPPTG